MKNVPDYATVQGIIIGVVALYILVVTIIGPENHSSRFEESRAASVDGEDNSNSDPSSKVDTAVESSEKP